jgi:hypothetical protein
MATQYAFGKIVTDGLVLALNAADPNSYPGSGTTWRDMSGNGNNGTLTNGPTFNSGNGGSIVFDGADDYIALGTPNSLNLLGTITINSWVKITAFSTVGNIGTIYEKGYDNNNDQIFFRFRNNAGTQVIDVGTYKGSNNTNYLTTYTIGSSITTGTWNNIVGQYDGTNWNIYLNSVLVSSTLQNQGPLTSTSPSSIGAAFISSGYARFLNGNIANLQIYNRALSSTEVLQNYNAQKSRFGL